MHSPSHLFIFTGFLVDASFDLLFGSLARGRELLFFGVFGAFGDRLRLFSPLYLHNLYNL